MDIDHDVFIVDEFDALSIEVVKPPAAAPGPKQYPAKEHARKVAKNLAAENGLVFIPGEPTMLYEDSDMGPAFHQRRYFYYLTGANFENCAVTYSLKKDHLILWIPVVNPREALYFGKPPSLADIKRTTDVDAIGLITKLAEYLHEELRSSAPLFVLHKSHVPKSCLLQPESRHRPAIPVNETHLQPAMDAARVIKTDYEIAQIRQANAVSSAAHREVLKKLKGMTSERDIEAVFRAYCLTAGAKRQAYPIIAGSGANAAVLHYVANSEPLEGRELVCLDAGAEWECYASDVTRTFPVSGKGAFSPEAAAIYAIVEKMQNECIDRVRPGVPYAELHVHAMEVAVRGLLDLGLLVGGSVDEILRAGTGGIFFPHGLGHHVGLDVHDVLNQSLMRFDPSTAAPLRRGERRRWLNSRMNSMLYAEPSAGQPTLQPGMIVTIEPGIYFNRQYIRNVLLYSQGHKKYVNQALLEKYYPVGGVRIEDCILVTADGYENLTTAPKGEQALHIINGE